MKQILNKLTLALGVISATMPALAQSKLLYLVPNGVAPNGKYALAAFEKRNEANDSDVAYYYAKVGADGSLNVASDEVFSYGNSAPNPSGYGPSALAWASDDQSDAMDSNYVISKYQGRKFTEVTFHRLVDGKYVSQVYKQETYEKEIDAVLRAEAKKFGYTGELNIVHRMTDSVVTIELPQSAVDADETDFDIEELDFSKPVYVVTTNDFTLQKDKAGVEEFLEVSISGVVKVEKDENGNLKDSKVSFASNPQE